MRHFKQSTHKEHLQRSYGSKVTSTARYDGMNAICVQRRSRALLNIQTARENETTRDSKQVSCRTRSNRSYGSTTTSKTRTDYNLPKSATQHFLRPTTTATQLRYAQARHGTEEGKKHYYKQLTTTSMAARSTRKRRHKMASHTLFQTQ